MVFETNSTNMYSLRLKMIIRVSNLGEIKAHKPLTK